MSAVLTNLVTAAQVRAFYNDPANADRLASLSEKAQATVRPGARGRLHPDVRKDYNSDHKGKAAYSEGTPKTVALNYRRSQPSGRTVKAEVGMKDSEARALAIRLGVEGVGVRGPLSKAAIAAIEKHLTEQSAAEVAQAASV